MHGDHDLDLALLEALDALLRERHVTRAARRTGITQSAMSRRLTRLREVFGDPLFVHAGKGLQPTPRAEALLAPLRATLDGIETMLQPVGRFEPGEARKTFALGGTDFVFVLLLPRLMRRFDRQARGIRLETHPLSADFPDRLESGELDLVIAPSRPEAPRLMTRTMFDDGLAVVARHDHPALQQRLTLQRYLEERHIVMGSRSRDLVDTLLQSKGHERRVALSVSHFYAVPQVLAVTDLLFTTGRRVAEALSEVTRLAIAPCPVPSERVRIGAYWHAHKAHDPAHSWLREAVFRAAREADHSAAR